MTCWFAREREKNSKKGGKCLPFITAAAGWLLFLQMAQHGRGVYICVCRVWCAVP